MTGRQDRYVGIGLLVLCGVMFWETLSFRKMDWEPLGMAFWPRVLLASLAAFAVYFLIRGCLDGTATPRLSGRAFAALGVMVGFALLLKSTGFLVLVPLLVFGAAMALRQRRGWRQAGSAALVAVMTTGVVYGLFHTALGVQLPEGLLK